MSDGPVIAIVDDDASVRRWPVRVVESAGYAAEGFASAREVGPPASSSMSLLSEMSEFDLKDRLSVPIERAAGPTVAVASGHGKEIA